MYSDTHGTGCTMPKVGVYNGGEWTHWAGHSFYIPWILITLYVITLFGLAAFMKNREPLKLRGVKVFWNFGLSLFSFTGFVTCLYSLLFDEIGGIFTAGIEASICTPASNFGCGYTGAMVGAFCFSKCFELLDTVWLLLAKKEIIFLHWYHHITVLAFCWYAYSVRASNGLYFAVVNYGVHMIMYFYYGMTQLGMKYRKMVAPYAMMITIVQISQMAFGLVIVSMTVYFKYHRRPCFTFPHVNCFAIIMYASYFVLFVDIFVRRYTWLKAKMAKRKKETEAAKKKA